ncbi:MAG: glycosyltransferase family 4 protein [Candidatus ainarchaeum sp.]|nr:glycosyltransferase family 4 protein [Candidatus ainarchaeum sp.]
MKKLDIFIQYPPFFSDSPYYNYLTNYPPKTVNYLSIDKKRTDIIIQKNKLSIVRFLKDKIRLIIRKLNLPIINAYYTKSDKEFGLIHCAHCLSLNNDKKWVVDLECAWQIGIGNTSKNTMKKAINILERKNCKRIICWTNKTKDELIKITNQNINEKIDVIYPAVPVNKKVNKNSKKINLVFVARYFKLKGGEYAINVINKLTKKYDFVNGIIVTDNIELAKSCISENNKIKFYSLMDRKELFNKIYTKTDIFIYPGLADSFGFLYLDVMSFGLPIITVDGYARKEIVEDGKSGFVVGEDKYYLDKEYDKSLEKQLIEKTEILIKDEKLRKKMGDYGYNLVKNGKFSIKQRNKLMKKVYEDAIKN